MTSVEFSSIGFCSTIAFLLADPVYSYFCVRFHVLLLSPIVSSCGSKPKDPNP